MTHGSFVPISSVVLAFVSVSALAAAIVRSWHDAARHRAERDAAAGVEARLRSQVRLLEVRIASLSDRLDALQEARAAYAFGAPAGAGGDPAGQVAPGAAQRDRDPVQRSRRLAAASNVIVFPGPSRRRARR